MITSEAILGRLESWPRKWAPYIRQQAAGVECTIKALRQFAEMKPGRVADLYNDRASRLEARLAALLSSLPEEV